MTPEDRADLTRLILGRTAPAAADAVLAAGYRKPHQVADFAAEVFTEGARSLYQEGFAKGIEYTQKSLRETVLALAAQYRLDPNYVKGLEDAVKFVGIAGTAFEDSQKGEP